MKTLLTFTAFALSSFIFSQTGVKAGLTYNADQGLLKTANNAYQAKGEGSTGFHVGVYKKFQLTQWFIMPEVWYVNYKNQYTDAAAKSFDVQYKRIDVPVSFGTSLFNLMDVKAGPVLSYYLEDDIDLNTVNDLKQDDITLALQVGAGLRLQNFDITARYDFPLGERETRWVSDNNLNFSTENTPKLLHLSVGYRF